MGRRLMATAEGHLMALVRAVPAAATLLLACYVALFMTLGSGLRGWLWDHGQHATPQQWRIHQQLEGHGNTDHHGRHPSHPGHSAHDWVDDWLHALEKGGSPNFPVPAVAVAAAGDVAWPPALDLAVVEEIDAAQPAAGAAPSGTPCNTCGVTTLPPPNWTAIRARPPGGPVPASAPLGPPERPPRIVR
jgi:hypothetical protein